MCEIILIKMITQGVYNVNENPLPKVTQHFIKTYEWKTVNSNSFPSSGFYTPKTSYINYHF